MASSRVYKSQVDIKQFWDVDGATQVGSCKLCPQGKRLTAQPEYRKLQSGMKKAYPNWNNMRKHIRLTHFKDNDTASEKHRDAQTRSDMDKFVKRRRRENENDVGNQETAVFFLISPNQLKDIVRQICTIDGLPFNTFEKTGMKQLIQPIIDQLKKNINRYHFR